VVHGTKEFLPHLVASGDGHVVNISSVFGLVAPPHLAAYDAAKFAVRGFTEALRAELLASRAPVQVTCVHPGGIRTAFVRHSTVLPAYDRAALERRFRRVAFSTPERAARTILNGVERNKARVLVGPDAYLLDLAQRLMVARYQRLAAWTARWAVPRVGD
jgi:short-subunit dehydrogenase